MAEILSPWNNFSGSRMVVWIRVKTDPYERQRGFSLVDKEFRTLGYNPVEEEIFDVKGHRMTVKGWPVAPSEMFRVCPELLRFEYCRKNSDKPWIFPFEFCESFVRPVDYLNYTVKDYKID